MKEDPGLDGESLAGRISTEYGLRVARLESLPKGEVGYCYLMDSDVGLRYLVKVLPSTRLGLNSRARIKRDCISYLPHLEPLIERTDQTLRRRTAKDS